MNPQTHLHLTFDLEPSNLAPEPSNLALESSNLAPEASNLALESSNLAPEPSNLAPEPSNLAPEPSNLAPEPSNLAPEAANSDAETLDSGYQLKAVPHSHASPSAAQNPIVCPDMHPEADPHSHVHDETSQRRLVNRLSRIEGHIRGVKTMIQEHRPCPEVLVQIAAVRGALDKVARVILDEHLTQCIGRAAKEGDPVTIEEEIEQLRSALNHFL